VKVKLVQRRLGMPASTWEIMDATTIAKVQAFQVANGLPADGAVGPVTWRALGFAEDFCFDRFQMTPQLPLSATPQQRIETFVTAAHSYAGDEYVWGGAGPKGYGMDCSGLVLQAFYAAGLDPQPISVDKHVLPDYPTSVELFNHPGLRHYPLAQVQRGDLVFYTDTRTGVNNHVAIALGGGQLLEAKDGDVHVSLLNRTLSTQTIVPEVVDPSRRPSVDEPAALVGTAGRRSDVAGGDSDRPLRRDCHHGMYVRGAAVWGCLLHDAPRARAAW
jgi:hypothetical protein